MKATKQVYRVYCEGREFGIDYSRAEAFRTAWNYRRSFPSLAYYARKIR